MLLSLIRDTEPGWSTTTAWHAFIASLLIVLSVLQCGDGNYGVAAANVVCALMQTVAALR